MTFHSTTGAASRCLRWLAAGAVTLTLTACGDATSAVAESTTTPAPPTSASPAASTPTPSDTPSATASPTGDAEPSSMSPSPSRSSAPASPAWWKGTIALPAHGSSATPARYLETFVTGDARLGCVWLADADGERSAVLWPTGYRAAFGPVRIYDPQGKVVWREGERHAVGGGPSEVYVERVPPACRTGDHAWWLPNAGEPHP